LRVCCIAVGHHWHLGEANFLHPQYQKSKPSRKWMASRALPDYMVSHSERQYASILKCLLKLLTTIYSILKCLLRLLTTI
jgi:hypothetical protein